MIYAQVDPNQTASGGGGDDHFHYSHPNISSICSEIISPSLIVSQPSPARVQEMAAEIERLRAELAASKAPPAASPDPIHHAIQFSDAPCSMIQYGRPGVLIVR